MYYLFIRRYNLHKSFKTLKELQDEVKCYLSPKQQRDGLLERLTTFTRSEQTNHFQDMECQYIHFAE